MAGYNNERRHLISAADSDTSTNSSPGDIQTATGKNTIGSIIRSISHQNPVSEPPSSPTYSTSSAHEEGLSKIPEGTGERVKPNLSVFEQAKLISKFLNWWRTRTKEKGEKKRQKELTEEVKMRHKLQYHFMSPYQKYKHGRKPWKLFIQIIKIVIVTTQVILFGAERFASVFFINHSQDALKNLFIQGYTDPEPFNYFSRQDLANAVIYAKERYKNLLNESVGIFWTDKSVEPIAFCVERHSIHGNDSANIDYKSSIAPHCEKGIPYDVHDLLEQFNKKHYFDSLKSLFLKFQIKTMFINGVRMHHRPECYRLNNMLYIDNENHDGKLKVSFLMESILESCPKNFNLTRGAEAIREFYIAFDILVVTLCIISLLLCVRSVAKSIMLGSVAQIYFKEYKGEELTKWDKFELINKWFIVLVLSDLLSIIGSIYKIRVDYRDIHYYNICSVFLGIGVLFVWVGILRFFSYLPNYNILLIALRVAAPNLMRFMFCALFIFFGFTFCGWIVLGPYHEKFNTFSKTCDCLYSLLNGDDMFPTFDMMSKSSTSVWIFSKIYLYIFISLFIYVVLSTFISIVSDSYERMKDSGRMPLTRIEKFMAAKSTLPPNLLGYCEVCMQDESLSDWRVQSICSTVESDHDLTSSQLSIVSAAMD